MSCVVSDRASTSLAGTVRNSRSLRQKCLDLLAILLRQQRARHVDEPPARLHIAGRVGEDASAAPPCRSSTARSVSRHFASGRRRQVPLPVQGASTRTASMRPARSSSGAPASRTWTLRVPARFSRSKIGARREPVAVGGDRSGPCSPSPRPGRASCRRRRRKGRGPARPAWRRPGARRAGCPRPAPRTSPSGRPARPARSGAAPRLPSARSGCRRANRASAVAPKRASAFSTRSRFGLQPVGAQIERRAERQRRALLHPIARRRGAEGAARSIRERRRAHGRARVARSGAASRSRSASRERLRRMRVAGNHRVDPVGAELPAMADRRRGRAPAACRRP